MAFKKIQDLSADVTISLGGVNRKTNKANPKSVEGYFLGSRQVDDKKKKSGKSYIWFFQTSKGNVGVWGKTDLDRKMLSVPPGTMVRASFEKMVATPNGEMYKYQVEIDDENTIEVVGANIVQADEEQAETTGSYTEDDDTVEDEDDEAGENYGGDVDDAPAPVSVTSAAERKAKVDALLAKNKKKA